MPSHLSLSNHVLLFHVLLATALQRATIYHVKIRVHICIFSPPSEDSPLLR